MVDIDIDFLPSKSTAANITSELGLVARQQLTEEMNNITDCTMLRDATTKKGHHFYTTQIKTSDKTLTLGVKEVKDGKAQTYVSCVNEVVSDINIQNYDYCTENFMNKIKNFMTDRSATESKENEIICADNDITVNSFKCSVHPLLQFGTVAQKKVGEIEKNYKINLDLNLGDSITENLLRFVSKLFNKDGSGDPLYAPTYLREQGINKVPIMTYRGNRFNTIFHNAAGTFYISKHLINYLTNSKSTLNYTQNFILTARKNDYGISICRALGIISKMVTEPYWRCDSDRNALKMGSIYEQLIDLLTNGANSPNLLITNRLQLVIGPQLEPDKVSQSLFEKSSLDDMTQSVLQQLCSYKEQI